MIYSESEDLNLKGSQMKEVIGLVVFLSFSIIILSLKITNRIDSSWPMFGLLSFFLVAGFVIARYDSIFKIKGAGFEIESFREEVTDVKNKAIEEIRDEVEAQKESIKLLTSEANQSRERLSEQQGSIESIVATAQEAEGRIGEQTSMMLSVYQ